jgi:hypothetical protein
MHLCCYFMLCKFNHGLLSFKIKMTIYIELQGCFNLMIKLFKLIKRSHYVMYLEMHKVL